MPTRRKPGAPVRPVGRPNLGLDAHLHIRVRGDELATWTQAAAAMDVDLSWWVRNVLTKAARERNA